MSELDLLDYQCIVLQYLDESQLLYDIKQSAAFYANVQDKAYNFKIKIDPYELCEICAELANQVLNEPLQAAKHFQEVVYAVLESLCDLPQCTSSSQVVVTFCITSLPELPCYQLRNAKDLITHVHSHGYKQYTGYVTGFSTLHKYTRSARYLCSESSCVGHVGNHYIRLHVPGACESQTVRADFRCRFCGSPLDEDLASRVQADKMLLEMVDVEAFGAERALVRHHHSLIVILRDELVTRGVEIGQRLSLIGIAVHDVARSKVVLEANNLLISEAHPLVNPAPTSTLPSSIHQLMHDRRSSPWSFALSLAYAFADHVAPSGTFLHLKLALLLSLVSLNHEQSHDVETDTEDEKQADRATDVSARHLDVLAFGNDSNVLHRLLTYASTLSDNAVFHTSNGQLTASVVSQKHDSDATIIEGGSLLLAHGGVCVIPRLDGTSSKQLRYSLLQVLESGRVFVDVKRRGSNHRAQHQQQLYLPRRCNVWAYNDTVTSASGGLMATTAGRNMGPLIDAFGLCVGADVTAGSYAESLLINHWLWDAQSLEQTTLISHEEFAQFLRLVRSHVVVTSSEAEELVRDYYVASRQVRACGAGPGEQVPITAVATIMQLAVAHAKLNLREEVSTDDAVAAILLYEESMTLRSGHSLLNLAPLTHIEDNDIQRYIGPERDAVLRQAYTQLKTFIANHAPAMTSFREE